MMALFGKKHKDSNQDVIVSAVILEQTQLYKNKSKWGLTFGDTLGDGQVIAMDNQVPAGMEIKFSVTYKSGRKEIVKVMSGTPECDRLLQLAIDPPNITADNFQTEIADNNGLVSLKKNQLTNGDYVIGKDIPAGNYDLTWVWGEATVTKYKDSKGNTLGDLNYIQHIGNKYDYQYRQCLNIPCSEGEVLKLQGNVIVEISKAKPVEIEL